MIYWEIKKFLKVILPIQLLILVLKYLNTLGLKIPIFTQIVGFIYLTIIPGILILRVFRINKLSIIEIFLYSVGLSISFLMFLGLFLNVMYPLIGIRKPLSTSSLIVTISIVILVLCIINYGRDNDYLFFRKRDSYNLEFSFLNFVIFIPFTLSVLGTYIMNFYNINSLLLILLMIISLIPIFVAFEKIPKNIFILVLFIISISLLYHRSLITSYIWGWDIHIEYYFSKLVKINSILDPISPHRFNAMLSIVMIAPIFSDICNISLMYTFKIIYPLLFSFVILGLYLVFKNQMDDNIAFLSCLFYMSTFVFYGEMLQLARQQIAELFLVLMILLMVNKSIEKRKRKLLFIIFSFSLTVSHYGMSTIYILLLSIVFLILFLIKKYNIVFLKNNLENKILSLNYVLLFSIFTLTWYIYMSNSTIFNIIVNIGNRIASNIFKEFLNPKFTEGLHILITKKGSPLLEVQRILHLISQIFIVFGLLSLFLKHNNTKFIKEYVLFSFVNLGILFACILVPHFARSLNTTRFYQITLFFLAPFCVIGGITVIKLLSKIFRIRWSSKCLKISLKILSIFFAVYLLFNSGFVNEVTKDDSISISLNNNIDFPRFNNKEVYGASWIADKTEISLIYGDEFGRLLLYEFAFWRVRTFNKKTEYLPYDAYVFFRSLNTKGKIIESYEKLDNYITLKEYNLFNKTIIKMNKIYDNGGAHIYH